MDQWDKATWLLILLCSFLSLNSSSTHIFIVSFPHQKMIWKESQAVCWPQRHLNPGTHGDENLGAVIPKWAGPKRPPAAVSPGLCLQQLSFSLQGPEFSLTSALISGFLLRFQWGRKDDDDYYFTSEKCFLFPKVKNSSNEMPPFTSSFSSFTSYTSSFSHPTPPSHFLCCNQHVVKYLLGQVLPGL